MRKYIYIIITSIALLWGFSAKAQKQADPEVCCFAKVEFKQDKVWLFIPDLSYNIKLLPQPQKGIFVSSSLRGPFCHSNEDFQGEIDRIKQNILNSDISKLDQYQQDIYIKHLFIALLWTNLFEIDSSIIGNKIEMIKNNITEGNQQSFDIIINLHQKICSNMAK